jgi:acetyl esterase/lipase
MDEATCADFARRLGIMVLSVDYRFAPEHQYPTPLEDCYAALGWLHSQPGVDHDRIAVGGASAGGGLAAAVAQLALDRGRFPVAFQLLTYPMLDDRSAVRTARPSDRDHRLWNRASNRVGWSAYLGTAPGSPGLTSPAVPSRREDLAGLAPTWIGVGSADLFHDEGVAYAARLEAARVRCQLCVVPGAFHGLTSSPPTHRSSRISALGVVQHYARLSVWERLRSDRFPDRMALRQRMDL